MNLAPAIPTFVITLREGVEAALVVGIVLACLSKAHQSQLNRWVYGGILAGLVGSILIGWFLGLGLDRLQYALPQFELVVKPLLATLFSAIAMIMLSWMLIWMTRQARSMKQELEGAVQSVLTDGQSAGWSLFSLICIAVLREGFETVLFLFTSVQQSQAAILGAIAGLLGATTIGLALFKWGVRINLRQFFRVMGVLLLLIVAGLVVSACKNLDAVFSAIAIYGRSTTFSTFNQTDLCFAEQSCILGPLLWDTSNILPDKQFPGIVLKVLLGYRDHIYLVQLLAYGLFLGVVGSTYFRSLNVIVGDAARSTTQEAIH